MRTKKRNNEFETANPKGDDVRAEASSGLTRRQALTAGVGAAATVVLTGSQAMGQTPPDSPPPQPTDASRPKPGEGLVRGAQRSVRPEKTIEAAIPRGFQPNFFEPKVVRAGRDKSVRQDVTVRKEQFQILQPDPETPGKLDYRLVETRAYNQVVPAPTVEVYAGDKLAFTLNNELPPNPPLETDCEGYEGVTCEELMAKDIPNCFNTTNLHTHGLHVSPSSQDDGTASDDIKVRVEPGESQPYLIWLPEFHAPGTHWYHAHVHGSTALQVADGLAGALIVKDPDDPAQQIPVDDDVVWVIQEIVGEPSSTVYGAIVDDENCAIYGTALPQVRFTVNGIDSGEMMMTTDQIQRWRMINATGTPRGFMNVALVDSQGEPYDPDKEYDPYTGANIGLNLMAVDGIMFYGEPAVPVDEHYMSPGNRADFLVQIPDPGTYYVIKKKAVIQSTILSPDGTGPTTDELLATIVVTGAQEQPRALPALPGIECRPCYLTPITDDPETNRGVEFAVVQPGVFGGYTVNGQPYGEHPPAIEVPYEGVETWNLTNTSLASHPFHIHVNPFQVEGQLVNPDKPNEPSNWRWQDVISVPFSEDGATPGEVRIRHRFLTYSGSFVIHCHVLVHEDCGMMRDVTVGPGGAPAGVAVAKCELP